MPRALGRGARAPRTPDCSTAVLDLEPGRGSGAVQLGIEEGTRTTCGCRRRRRVFGRLSNGGGARGRVRGNLCRRRRGGLRSAAQEPRRRCTPPSSTGTSRRVRAINTCPARTVRQGDAEVVPDAGSIFVVPLCGVAGDAAEIGIARREEI
jgi:hypothetical protein